MTRVFISLSIILKDSRGRMKTFVFLLFFVSHFAKLGSSNQTRVIETGQGRIIGSVNDVDVFGETRTVSTFLGIPYAEPPVGNLRFRKTSLKKPFTSPFEALQHGNACLQVQMQRRPGLKELDYAEDCLFLNVYVPAEGGQGLAVMLWIHGGGFVTGTSDPYTAYSLAAYGNVIVVTINYRLSVFGFLSTGDENAPGNYGLWDQHLAIQWVSDNIRAFGGDPEKITIFGESAGSGSVVYQSLYVGNQGLFQRAIAQSGSITASWAFTADPKQETERFARLIGCDHSKSAELVECLRQQDAETLTSVLNNVENRFGFTTYPISFVPSLDGVFVKEVPKQILKPEKEVIRTGGLSLFSTLDFLTGITTAEGLLLISPFIGVSDAENFEPNRSYYEKVMVPQALSFALGADVPNSVKDMVISEYTDWDDSENLHKIRDNLAELYSDTVFTIPLIDIAAFHHSLTQRPRTYMYTFDARPSKNLLKTPTWSKGANHASDLLFLFDGVMPYFRGEDFIPTDWDRTVSKYMITLWTNFAKTGNPNKPSPVPVEWPVYNNKSKQYLEITSEMTLESVKKDLRPRKRNLWSNIIPSLYQALEEARNQVSVGTSSAQKDYCDKEEGCEP